MSVAEEVAEILLDIKAVTLRPEEPFRYSSGIVSPIYTDCRLLISHPKQRSRVIKLMADLIQGKPDLIAGTATAGIPHAAWLAAHLDLPMVYARSKAKEHGKQMQIEGLLRRGQKVIVVEDLISTAGSSIETVQTIRENGGQADNILAIFTYELPEAEANLKSADVGLRTLTNFKTIAQIAVGRGLINSGQLEAILAWNNQLHL